MSVSTRPFRDTWQGELEVRHNASAIKKYDPGNLPLRNHAEMLDTARTVQFATTNADFEHFATESGIKGVSILAQLSSISFPNSSPYDFMHLIFENIMKHLVLLWTGGFKGLDEGNECYELPKKVWEAIGADTAASGSTIPYAFGAHPPNVAELRLKLGRSGCSILGQFCWCASSRRPFTMSILSTW
jgi:hypothetical protein